MTRRLLPLLLLAGCAKESVDAPPVDSTYYNAPFVNIYEMRLKDGTRCVYISSGTGVGITCDWKREEIEKGAKTAISRASGREEK